VRRVTGRFAPSPTGPLHLGNLRTAAIAWLSARSQGAPFLVRFEDLDRSQSSIDHERSQLADLDALGIDWDGVPVRQSDRFDRYHGAIAALADAGRVYECYCTRREILEAPSAPHGPPGSYPGTCRDLTDRERARRRATRPPALRLRSGGGEEPFEDRLRGRSIGVVDDVVLRRNDGVPAYNLAVVVDDAAQGVTDVTRGDDLLASTPRQVRLQRMLGLDTPTYLHVPLVVGADGARLSKRHGDVTLTDLRAIGVEPARVVDWILRSIGAPAAGDGRRLSDAIDGFDETAIPRTACRQLLDDGR
jgi:glutamyl-tRNA synthetase